jgi:2-oxoglutarate ferredoxin oxidoreductase subunit alpha
MFEFGWKSFDIAERIQTPVFVLNDLDMGMNQWISKPFQYPETPIDRGKVLLERTSRNSKAIGDVISTKMAMILGTVLSRNKHPLSSYFTRYRHDEYAKYTEEADIYLHNMDRLKERMRRPNYMFRACASHNERRRLALSYGSTEAAILKHNINDKEHGIKTTWRIRALP